jgi:dsRNA-specific ribonuclease
VVKETLRKKLIFFYKIKKNMSKLPIEHGVYIGDRTESFRMKIESILKSIEGLKQKYIDLLLTEESMKVYGIAFTSETVAKNKNYQFYELLGDRTFNKFIVSYFQEKLTKEEEEELNPSYTKVIARLLINYGSKKTFFQIAEKLELWDFITATLHERSTKKKDLCEDVLESFIGATEFLINKNYNNKGKGYGIVYIILKSIFDKMSFSFRYEDLFDSKTRLKELFDFCGDNGRNKGKTSEDKVEKKLGKMVYESEKTEDGMVKCTIYNSLLLMRESIGVSIANTKDLAEQKASENAITTLKKRGILKHPPAIYKEISPDYVKEKTKEQDVLKACDGDFKNINNQFHFFGKSEYKQEYTCTPLSLYIIKSDIYGIKICLKNGAKPEIKDNEGMNSLDLLMLNYKDEVFVKKVFKLLKEHNHKLNLNKKIKLNYYNNLTTEYFKKLQV